MHAQGVEPGSEPETKPETEPETEPETKPEDVAIQDLGFNAYDVLKEIVSLPDSAFLEDILDFTNDEKELYRDNRQVTSLRRMK